MKHHPSARRPHWLAIGAQGPAALVAIFLAQLLSLFFMPPAGHAIGPYTSTTTTVTDQATGLEWQRADDATARTWENALSYCADLSLNGQTDWRLPNVRELKSIVDHTRYSPAIDPVFSGQSSHYWSATTSGHIPNDAWSVRFYEGFDSWGDKTYSHYVRCVRSGLSGGLGSAGSFVFAAISATVSPDACFPVRVEARSASGVVDTTVNGNVSLGVNDYGGVSPTSLTFINGVAANNCVKVLTAGVYKQLSAQGFSRSGVSGYFNSTGSCSGTVTLLLQQGVTAILTNAGGAEVGRQLAVEDPQSHRFIASFAQVPCGGSYRVRIEKGSQYKDDTVLDVTAKGVVKAISLSGVGIEGTPVILIPGIMGSSRPTNNFSPLMKGNYPDKGLEFHWPFWTGWDGTHNYLVANGYTVFRCPWDWRGDNPTSLKRSVAEFLIPVINEALRVSTTGKVHIIAHSMGGLLAREYIQGSLYRKDVDKLALMAVPNLGSANPYFLWEAGDIYTTAKVFDDNDAFDGLYGNTTQRLWEKTFDKPNWKKCNTKAIGAFVQEKAPSMRQLLWTEKMLVRDGTYVPVIAAGHENVWLKALNNGTDGYAGPSDVFSRDGAGDTVTTRVFLGNQAASTLRAIEVSNSFISYPDGTTDYPDGIPLDVGPMGCSDAEMQKKATNSHVIWRDGDTTVPIESSKYPMTAGWADREDNISGEDHPKIMKDFRGDVVGFLKGTRNGVTTEPGVAQEQLAKAATEKDAVETRLAFSIIGNAGILVTDSQGRRIGVTPDTHEVVNEIPGAEMGMDDMVTTLSIINAEAGQYLLTYYGLSEQEFSLDISAMNSAGKMEEESFDGFKPEAPQTMTVVYNPAASDFLVTQPVVAAPQELEAEPYACGAGKCARLKWKASTGAGVTQHVIYRALVNTPFYAERIRLSATTVSYDTGDAWDSANDSPVNGYAVAAIKADTKESFFAEEKDEIAQPFPWTMFLPAITNKKVK